MSNEIVKQDHYMGEFEYAKKVGQMIVKSGKFAKDWNEDTVGILVLYAKDLGIHPVTALINGFDIIQGKISMKPVLMANMIRRKGHSIEIVKNDQESCVLRGKRRDTGDICEVSFSLEDAKRAGIAGKDSFQKWAADMLYNRAMGRLGRMLFADVIGGAYSDGEMEDIQASTPPKKNKGSRKVEDLQEAEVETIDAAVESKAEPENDLEAPTIDDLGLKVAEAGKDVDLAKLGQFVQYLAIKHGKAEEIIIKSALQSDEQFERFTASYLKSLEEKPS